MISAGRFVWALLIFAGVVRFRKQVQWIVCWFFFWTDKYSGAMTALATVAIAAFTWFLVSTSNRQDATLQQHLEMAERPFVAPSAYNFSACGNGPSVSLENFGHKPAKVLIWTGQGIDAGPHGPDLSKQPFQKIVIPNALQGERIDFKDFAPVKSGSSCFLSGMIEYNFLNHRYCTRFCRYMTPPDAKENPCRDLSTNNLAEDGDCDHYDVGMSGQP
jgi:hypothetical protein